MKFEFGDIRSSQKHPRKSESIPFFLVLKDKGPHNKIIVVQLGLRGKGKYGIENKEYYLIFGDASNLQIFQVYHSKEESKASSDMLEKIKKNWKNPAKTKQHIIQNMFKHYAAVAAL